MLPKDIKNQVINLRQQGKTYQEIQQKLGRKIAKSTLSYWCRYLILPPKYKDKLKNILEININKARGRALAVNKAKRENYLKSVADDNKHLIKKLNGDTDSAKMVLAALYLGEGTKKQRGALTFGNSDPAIVSLFLKLLRQCYKIDEQKFRCTLQCRADQDIKFLEKFWSKITKISPRYFYKARIDPRTIGKPSKKLDYRGVCRIDYFSAEVFNELIIIGEILTGAVGAAG